MVTLLKSPIRALLLLTALLALTAPPVTSANAGACLADTRQVDLGGSLVRLKDYACRAGAGAPSLRVQFHRLTELAASAIMRGNMSPGLQKIFGRPKIVNNAVYQEHKRLLDRYGSQVTLTGQRDGDVYVTFKVDTPKTGRGMEARTDPLFRGRHTILSDLLSDWSDMPVPDDIVHIRNQTNWPPGYRIFYSDAGPLTIDTPINAATLWRYMTRDDLARYAKDRDRYNRMLGGGQGQGTPSYVSMLQDLASQSWPNDFILVTGSYDACGGDVNFSFYQRRLLLDVALVQNLSSSPVRVDGLQGLASNQRTLRPVSLAQSARGAGKPLGSAFVLNPGETAVIPMKMTFVPPKHTLFEQLPLSEANKTFAQIRATPPGTMFVLNDLSPPVRKVREAFPRPTKPNMKTYVYGPEIALNGLTVNGQTLTLEGSSANFLALTAGADIGSCPYLYAWSDTNRAWMTYGKIIKEAHGKEKEMTQRIVLAEPYAKFRLTEKELELAHIDQARLILKLRGGNTLTLKPSLETLKRKDGRYVKIYAGQTVAFDFAFPPGLDKKNIEQSTLEVTGFYKRYGAMRMTAR